MTLVLFTADVIEKYQRMDQKNEKIWYNLERILENHTVHEELIYRI